MTFKEKILRNRPESLALYIKRKRRELEAARDAIYKNAIKKGKVRAFTRTFRKATVVNKQLKNSKPGSAYHEEVLTHADDKQSDDFFVSSDESTYGYDASDEGFSEDEDLFLKRPLPIDMPFVRGENDRIEALEFNGKQLPLDFLMAKLSHNRKTKRYYLTKKKKHAKEAIKRMDSDFFFSKPDIYREKSTMSPLLQKRRMKRRTSMNVGKDDDWSTESDSQKWSDEDEGRSQIDLPREFECDGFQELMNDFICKTNFLQSIKDNNKLNCR